MLETIRIKSSIPKMLPDNRCKSPRNTCAA
jgi:hypothetical protein